MNSYEPVHVTDFYIRGMTGISQVKPWASKTIGAMLFNMGESLKTIYQTTKFDHDQIESIRSRQI